MDTESDCPTDLRSLVYERRRVLASGSADADGRIEQVSRAVLLATAVAVSSEH